MMLSGHFLVSGVCSYYLVRFWVSKWPPFGKELLTQFTICSLKCMLTICDFSFSPFLFFLVRDLGSDWSRTWSLHTCYFYGHMQVWCQIKALPKSSVVEFFTNRHFQPFINKQDFWQNIHQINSTLEHLHEFGLDN